MLRDNTGRARAARLVFLLYALVTAAVVLASGAALLLSDWSYADNEQATALQGLALMFYGLLLVGQFLINLTSYVFLILWLRRAYYNLHQLPNIHPDYSDGWAAGAWFVPFISFVRPYTITREVWNDTQRAAFGQIRQPATILGWWWAAYLLKLVVSQITGRLTSGGNSGITLGDLPLILSEAAVSLAFAMLTWYSIGRMAAFEEQLALHQQLSQLGQPAPTPTPQPGDQSDYALEEGY